MFDGNRNRIRTFVTAIFAALIVTFYTMIVWGISGKHTEEIQNQQAKSASYAANAEKEIQGRCMGMQLPTWLNAYAR